MIRHLVILLLILCSCTTVDPLDVQADRDRWTAVRDVTADGQVDEMEAPLLAQLLVAWDDKLTRDEAAAGQRRDARSILADLIRVYGAATVQVFAGPELQARAPELFRFVDVDSDGVLSEQELLAIDPLNPVFALVVASTAKRLLERR